MALDGVRAFVQLAMGVSDATRSRAVEAAQGLLGLATKAAPGDVGPVVTALADDLLAAAAANRELILELVRTEVSTILESSAGLVRGADLDAVRGSVGQLSGEVDTLRRQLTELAPWLDHVGSTAMGAVSALPGAGKRPQHDVGPVQDARSSRPPTTSADPAAPPVRRTPSRPGPGVRRRLAAQAAAAEAAPSAEQPPSPDTPSPEKPRRRPRAGSATETSGPPGAASTSGPVRARRARVTSGDRPDKGASDASDKGQYDKGQSDKGQSNKSESDKGESDNRESGQSGPA